MNQYRISEFKEPEKLWNKSFILILIISTCNNSASMMITPLISKYALSLGIPLTIAATIVSLMSIVALVLRPISGLCSDRFNRKKIIILTSIGTSLSMFGYSLANGVLAMVIVRLFHGMVFSFSSVALMAFNTTFMPKDKLGEGLGWMSIGQIISFTIGPSLGLALVERYSYEVCFSVAASLCIISMAIVISIPYPYSPSPVNAKSRLDINNLISLRILPYAMIMGLFSFGNGLENTFLALIGDERNIAGIGTFFTAYSIALVLVRPWSGKLYDRKGIKLILYASLCISFVGILLLGFARSLPFIIFSGILKAVGQGSGTPAIQATCMKQLGREKAGVVNSTCFIGQDIGNAVAPIIGGYVASAYGYTTVFAGYAALLLIGGYLIFFLKVQYDERKYGSV